MRGVGPLGKDGRNGHNARQAQMRFERGEGNFLCLKKSRSQTVYDCGASHTHQEAIAGTWGGKEGVVLSKASSSAQQAVRRPAAPRRSYFGDKICRVLIKVVQSAGRCLGL